MKYLVVKEFNENGIWGRFNLPVGTEVVASGGKLYFGSKPICGEASQQSHAFFARNDDGKAQERHELAMSIIAKLNKMQSDYKAKVEAVQSNMLLPPWEREERISEIVDESALAFERIHGTARADACLTNGFWNHDFFNAPIQTLELIMSLVEGQEGVPQA